MANSLDYQDGGESVVGDLRYKEEGGKLDKSLEII